MQLFKILTESKLRNFNNVTRFGGEFMFVKDDLAHHVTDMCMLFLELYAHYDELQLDPDIDRKSVIYRIVIHDLDEVFSQDVARKLKYHTPELAKAINDASRELAEPHLTKQLLEDVSQAKGPYNKEAVIVKVLDILQATLHVYRELFLLGNKSVSSIWIECVNHFHDAVIKEGLLKDFSEEIQKDFRDLSTTFKNINT